jgi:hypothetical protein
VRPTDAASRVPERWAAYAEAMRRGDYFRAHEWLEDSWRQTRDPREQALIWIAAAFVHWQRGRPAGVERLLEKVEGRLRETGDAAALLPVVSRWREAAHEHRPCPGVSDRVIRLALTWAGHRTERMG